MKYKTILYFVVSFFSICGCFAQNFCEEDYEACTSYGKDGYIYDLQTKVVPLSLNKKKIIKYIFYPNISYRFSLCENLPYLDIQPPRYRFQLQDGKTKDILYDNKEDNYTTDYIYVSKYSRVRKIILIAWIEAKSKKDSEQFFEEFCLGILLEHSRNSKHVLR